MPDFPWLGGLEAYVVIAQSVAPNTAITFSFDPDYENIVASQSLAGIELQVTRVGE